MLKLEYTLSRKEFLHDYFSTPRLNQFTQSQPDYRQIFIKFLILILILCCINSLLSRGSYNFQIISATVYLSCAKRYKC